MRTPSSLLAVIAFVAIPVGVHADGVAVAPTLGSSGLGADVTFRLSPRFNVRAGGSLPLTPDADGVRHGDVEYDVKLKLGGVNAFLDWHPFTGNFRLSGGLTTIRSPWTHKAVTASSYKINGVTYSAADVGTLSGEHRFGNDVAPAILVGWGNAVRPDKRWGVTVDMGLAYVGDHTFTLEADGPLRNDATFQGNLSKERMKHSSDNAFWPIARIGVTYQF